MKRLLISCSTLVLVSLTSCDRGPDASSPSFITSTGTFKLFNKKMTVDVVENLDIPEGRISYTVTRGGATAELTWKDAPIQRGSPWFIYPASADSVWVYHGDVKNVLLFEYSEQDNTFKFTSNQVVADLVRKAPPAFLDRLPPSLKPQ